MAQVGTKTMIEWQCDACKQSRFAIEGTVPKGFTGDVVGSHSEEVVITDDGFKTWYSCSIGHVTSAIRAVSEMYDPHPKYDTDDESDED